LVESLPHQEITMTKGKGTRGRPKGSGINDREILLKIATISAANPAMKTTTAIKQAGVNNPSTIRRLRDKFTAERTALLAEVKGIGVAGAAAVNGSAAGQGMGARSIRIGTGAAAPTSSIAQQTLKIADRTLRRPIPQPQVHAQPQKPVAAPAMPGASVLGGASLERMVMQFVGQILEVKPDAVASHPVGALIKEQLRLIEVVLPLIRAQMQASQLAAKSA
jgi:hypothetical protein